MESAIHDIINSLEDTSAVSVYIESMPHKVVTWNTSEEYEIDHTLSTIPMLYEFINNSGATPTELLPADLSKVVAEYDSSNQRKTTAYALHCCLEEVMGSITTLQYLINTVTAPCHLDTPLGLNTNLVGDKHGVVGFAHSDKGAETWITILARKDNKQAQQAVQDILQVVFSDLKQAVQ